MGLYDLVDHQDLSMKRSETIRVVAENSGAAEVSEKEKAKWTKTCGGKKGLQS